MSTETNLIDLTGLNLLTPNQVKVSKDAISVEELAEKVAAYTSDDFSESLKFYETLKNGEIPGYFPDQLTRNFNHPRGYAIVAEIFGSAFQEIGYYGKATMSFADSLKAGLKHGVFLDPMMGNGFMVRALRKAGFPTIGTDNNSWRLSEGLENIDALESLKKYGNFIDYLLISWAPWSSDIDLRLLQEVRENYRHITIINIGEHRGGCTGSEEFWDEAYESYMEVDYKTLHQVTDFVTLVN